MRLRSSVLLGILLTLTTTLAAQQHRESVTVEVIDVPVYVTRGGEPVEGLTREDFELYVNGRRHPIDYFDSAAVERRASARRRVRRAEARRSTLLRERRLFLLLFDLAFSHPHAIVRAQRAAAEAIGKAGVDDYFAVATYSAGRGVWFAVPFTRERAALTRAISNLSHSRSGDPLSIVMTSAERETFGGGPSDVAITGDAMGDLARMRTMRAAEDQVLDLGDLTERLAPLDGEKHVVLLSEGYEGRTRHPFDVRVARVTPRAGDGGRAEPGTGTWPSWDHTLVNQTVRMHEDFQRANVLLHAIDLEGVSRPMFSNDSFSFLVTGTGGQFIRGHNDLRVALDDLSGKLAGGYRLGFRPADAQPGYNSIRVKLRESRGVRVHHRRGFFGTPSPGDVNDGLYLADILLNDVPQSGTAALLSLRGRTLTATIPMREVAAQLPTGATAELLLYAFDATGTPLLYHRQSVPVTSAEQQTVEVTVPEGTRVAKALLRVDGRVGFSRVGD